MPKMKFLKTLIFPRALQKLQNLILAFFLFKILWLLHYYENDVYC